MSLDLQELCRQVRSRPGMYLGGSRDPDPVEVRAFLTGVDLGSQGALLTGFREWLVVHCNGPSNFAWPGIIELAVLPDRSRGHVRSEEEDATLAAATWDLLDAFLTERRKHGLAYIYQRHAAWSDERALGDLAPVGSINWLEGGIDSDPPPEAGAHVLQVHQLRRRPVSSLSAVDCHRLVSHWLSIETVTPRSIELLLATASIADPSDEADLLRALLALGPAWWEDRPTFLGDLTRMLQRRSDLPPDLAQRVAAFEAELA